jgi:hypothetical protein
VSDDDDSQPFGTCCVIVDDTPHDTGLLDQFGRPLHRVEIRRPIGFDTNLDHYRPKGRPRKGAVP